MLRLAQHELMQTRLTNRWFLKVSA